MRSLAAPGKRFAVDLRSSLAKCARASAIILATSAWGERVDVRAWLEGHDLGQYAEAFVSNDIDAEVLCTLTVDDLKELGIASLGHRKKLLAAIVELGRPVPKRRPALSAAPPEAYTPSHLAERILDARARLTGERKHVTVLFADIKGSLAIIEGIDPEEAGGILDGAIRVMMDAVHRYEGTVNRVMGDGVMALFGAPIAHEDHAVRACYAALAIQRTMPAHAAEARADPRHRGQRPDRPAFGRGRGPHDRQRPEHGLRCDRPDRPSGESDGATGEPGRGQADRGDRQPRRGLRRPAGAGAGAGQGSVAADRGVRSARGRCGAHAPPGSGRPRPEPLRRP